MTQDRLPPQWNRRIREENLNLRDITTHDVSTSAHGFVPKAPNDTTKFLRGDGSWAVPEASGADALSALILADTPTGYWKCDDSGATLVDSSGNGYDMAVVGSPTMQSHYLLPTDNTKYMRINASGQGGSITSALGTSPPLTGDWTVEAITSLDNAAVTNFVIFSLGSFASELETLNLQLYCYRRTANNGGPSVLWESGAGSDTFVHWPFTSLGLPLFKPLHIAWVKDGTAETVTFYVGGMKMATAVSYGGTEPSGGTGTIFAKIGYDGTNAHNLGIIGHVAFYNAQKISDAGIWARARAAGLAGFVAAI